MFWFVFWFCFRFQQLLPQKEWMAKRKTIGTRTGKKKSANTNITLAGEQWPVLWLASLTGWMELKDLLCNNLQKIDSKNWFKKHKKNKKVQNYFKNCFDCAWSMVFECCILLVVTWGKEPVQHPPAVLILANWVDFILQHCQASARNFFLY